MDDDGWMDRWCVCVMDGNGKGNESLESALLYTRQVPSLLCSCLSRKGVSVFDVIVMRDGACIDS
jgi:hypothetical protein